MAHDIIQVIFVIGLFSCLPYFIEKNVKKIDRFSTMDKDIIILKYLCSEPLPLLFSSRELHGIYLYPFWFNSDIIPLDKRLHFVESISLPTVDRPLLVEIERHVVQ